MSLLKHLTTGTGGCHQNDRTLAAGANHQAGQCGPDKLDAWCGAMPAADSALARRCYQANILFIDDWVGQVPPTWPYSCGSTLYGESLLQLLANTSSSASTTAWVGKIFDALTSRCVVRPPSLWGTPAAAVG